MTEQATRVLYNYFRSSASYRVRIALQLKGMPYAYQSIHLNRNGGEQFGDPFTQHNPQQLVPVLADNGTEIAQSLAIMEYLDEVYPAHPLLPASATDRAYVRQVSQAVACEIHPLNNLRVLKYLTGPMALTEEKKLEWIQHWIHLGFTALEEMMSRAPQRGSFCFGNTPTMADCCLVPQIFNARRFDVDMQAYPTLLSIDAACQELDAFRKAHPAAQPDSE